ncbi:MAG: DUF448 domain-containing protein [Sphingomicrobium sp.]
MGRTLLREPQNDTLASTDSPERLPKPVRAEQSSERTCVVSRRTAPRDELIRLALSPDGEVAPDIRAKAPGRGAWIGLGRAQLDAAQAKGKLKAGLARAFKTNDVAIPPDLGERIASALRQQALDRLGLEARSGMLLNGSEKIESAARQGKVHLLIHAADAGEDGNRKLDQALRVGGGAERGLVFPEDRSILSIALGRENVVHVALTDPAAARRVRLAIDRWLAFIQPEAGLEGGDAAPAEGPDVHVDEGNA